MEAATAPLSALNSAQQDRIEHLARESGLTAARFIGLARRFVADIPDLDVAFAELDRAVTIAIEVQTRGLAGSNTGDFVAAVLARMAELSAEGRDDAAAAEADRAFAEWEERQRLEAQQGIALLEAGLRADILRRDAASAARRIAQRVELETPDPAKRFAALRAAREPAHARGRDQGLNFDLEIAIELGRIIHASAGNAAERASALNDTAVSLQELGERQADTARLEAAVKAYRAALREDFRERVPRGWGLTQMNLGNALALIGTRRGDPKWLEEAVVAYDAALEELTREHLPFEWATATMNLANARRSLGGHDSDTERLKRAVAAYRAALEELTRERAPRDWARAQMNLGNIHRLIGEREGSTDRIRHAIFLLEGALEEQPRERVPLDRGRTHQSLGTAFQALWELEGGTELLKRAASAFRTALEELTLARAPLEWAKTKAHLAVTLALIADRSGQTREAALAEIDAALEVFRTADAEADLRWAEGIRGWIAAGPAR